jgi:[ribosomal protein S5]-alanine N-acetyltransferase
VADGSKDDRSWRSSHAVFLGTAAGEEALRAVLAYGFEALGLPTIVAGHGIGHNNSQKLLERVGFAYTHNIMWGPKAIEVRMYAISAGMWRSTGRERERLSV